jgi:hypothetical protein
VPVSRLRWIALGGAVFAGGVVLGLTKDFWVLAGVVPALGIAVGLWRGWRPIVDAANPIAELGRALLPLLLPVLVAVAAGTVESNWIAQVLVGVAVILVGVVWIIAPEWREPEGGEVADQRPAIKWRIPTPKPGPLLAIALVALAIVIVVAAVKRADLESRGWVSTLFFGEALALWLIAIALRFFAYAESRIRLVVSVAVSIAVLRCLMFLGLLPLHDQIKSWEILGVHVVAPGSFLLVAAAFVLAAAVLEGIEDIPAIRRRLAWVLDTGLALRRKVFAEQRTTTAGSLGLGAAVMAAVSLSIALAVGFTEASSSPGETVAGGYAPAKPEFPGPDQAGPAQRADQLGDRQLADAYMPILAFTEDQQWSPIPVNQYLRNATLLSPNHKPNDDLESVQDLPPGCPSLSLSACHRLVIHCPEGENCAHAHGRDPDTVLHRGAVYVRVERNPKPNGRPNPAFASAEVVQPAPTTLIQYWFFYYNNKWTAPVLGGDLIERHTADWEAVMIGLDDEQPSFVAYTAHCGGSWAPWDRIKVAKPQPGSGLPDIRPRLHPLVAVAEGSQANYIDADQDRAPNWAGCSGKLPDGAATLLSYASNIRDKTEYGWEWMPNKPGQLRMIEKACESRRGKRSCHLSQPMAFPGTWAKNAVTLLKGYLRRDPESIGKPQGGPATPSLQPLWKDPLQTVFCAKHWRAARKHRELKVDCG